MAQNLKIIIVGAGIGGLTAAIALRQQGHEVQIYERSRLASEVGAAVNVAPNCTVLLNRFGIFPEEFAGTVYQGIVLRDSTTKEKFRISVEEQRKHWQAEYWLVHRIDLHAALKAKATSPTDPGTPVTLHTATAITHVDPATATITLADTTTRTADLVAAVDGVASVARAIVAGGAYPVRSSGKCCYRWLMPFAAVADDPALAALSEVPGTLTEVAGADRRVVFYPCSGAQLMNCAAFVPVEEVGTITKGWDAAGNKEKLIKSFAGFAPEVIRMLEKAPEQVAVWDLTDMDDLPTWVNGRVALLGDAAHPFLPYMGQGAAQAIEDAGALAALLPLGTAVGDVPRRLQLYEKARKERADWVREFTRRRGRDDFSAHDELAAAFEYCLSHDAWKHATEILMKDTEGHQGARI